MKHHVRKWSVLLPLFLGLMGVILVTRFAARATPALRPLANPPWATNVRVDDDAGANNQESPALAVGTTGNLYAVWRDFRHSTTDAALYFARSSNQGVTWTANATVSLAYADVPPEIAATGPLTVHVAWWQNDWATGFYPIYYNRSADGGQTWGTDQVVKSGDYAPSHLDIAADNAGRVYIVWASSSYINLGRSLNGGTTWVTLTHILTNEAISWSMYNPALAIDSPTGTLHLVWDEEKGGTSICDVCYARSTDQGQTWTDRQCIRQTTPNLEPAHPDIALDPVSQRIHVVWQDTRSGSNQIYHASSSNSGISWGTPISISGSGGPTVEPAVTAVGDGVLYVVWQDGRNGDDDVYYTRSTDGSQTWDSPSRVNDDVTSQPQRRPAIASGGGVYAIWDDARLGNADIYATRILTCPVSLAGVSITGTNVIAPGVSVNLTGTITPTNVTTPVLYTWSPAPNSGQGTSQAQYLWPEPGYYLVNFTAQNCGGTFGASHGITVTCSAPVTGVSISGVTAADAGVTVTLTATVTPPGARTPITYTWSPAPAFGQGTSQAKYVWHTIGTQVVTVTATNCSGAWGVFSVTHTVDISDNTPPAWSNFTPTNWITATDFWGNVSYGLQAVDAGAGLAVSTARESHSTDGGNHWTAWSSVSCPGGDGTTAPQTIESFYAFGQDSGATHLNQVKFVITDTAGNPSSSPAYNVDIDTVPPTNPTAVSSNRPTSTWSVNATAVMTWTGAADASSGVRGFAYEWSQSSTTVSDDMDTTSNTASTTIPGDGSNWYFHVRAVDNAGWWASGAYHSGPYRLDTTPPATPVVYSSDPVTGVWTAKNNIYVSFGGSSDPGGSGTAGYSYLWDTSLTTIPDTITDTGNLSGPLPNGIYYFHIRARDVAGNWTPTTHYGPFLIDTTPPTAPVIVSSDPGLNVWTSDNTISVTWAASYDAVGVSGYAYQWDNWPVMTPNWVTQTAGLNATSAALTDGTWYFHIAARDLAGQWSPVTHYGPFKVDANPPTNPTLHSTSHSPNAWSYHQVITETWYGASDGLGSGVYGYSYKWSNSASDLPPATIMTTGNSAASSALADGTWYFHIRTRDVAGQWNTSAAHDGPFKIDATPPTNPTSFTSTPAPGVWTHNSNVTVSWGGASDGAGSGVDGYSIEWSHSPSTVPDALWDTSDNSTAKDLYTGNDWYLHVRTRDKMYNWSPTAAHYGPFYIDVTTPHCSASSPPSSPNNDFTVSWAGSDVGAGTAGYDLQWRDVTMTEQGAPVVWTPWLSVGANTTSATFTGETGHFYQFQCRARDQAGNVEPWPSSYQSQTGVASMDLEAVGLEVTQGIQDMNNSVPLIGGKRTYVRFHVRSRWADPTPMPVTAQLQVWRQGTYMGVLLPSNPGGAITMRQNPDRGQLDDSFYFELPPDWLGYGIVHMEAVVNPDQKFAEASYSNNMAQAYVNSRYTYPLCVHVVPIATTNPPGAYFWVDTPGFWDIIALLQRYYPLADSGVKIYTGKGIMPKSGQAWNLNDEGTWTTVLNALVDYSSHWSDPPGCMRLNYYGMILPDIPAFYNGLGRIPGNAAIGRMVTGEERWPPPSGGQTMAHEMGHNYGRPHVACTGTEEGPDPGYPYPGTSPCRIANDNAQSYYGLFLPITSTVPVVIPPTNAADLMTYGNRRWISDYTYRALMYQLGGGTSMAAAALPATATQAGEYVYAAGLITPTDPTATLGYFYRTSDPKSSLLQSSLESTLNVTAPYSLTLEDASGAALITYPFQPSVAMGDDGVITNTVSFGLLLPLHPDTARISLYQNGVKLAFRSVSANAPTVNILSPAGGESLTNTLIISWQASDADLDELRYVVRYSPDNGTTWHVLATDWPNTTLTLTDLDWLPGSSQARVQVIASDGVNTGQATSAPFSLIRHAPLAHIIEPYTGSVYDWKQPVVLRGAALDAEDGTITSPSQMRWTSDISGALGAGPELWLNTLPLGTHRITLTVTDSDLMTATDQIMLTVGLRVYLPIVLRQ